MNAQDLIEAHIYFQRLFGNDEQLYTISATNLMKGISHVHKLRISGGTVGDLVENNVPVPVFQNLTHLEFSFRFEDVGFADTLYFLESFNSLETLYFVELPSVFNLDAWYAQEESRAGCLSYRLKTIKIAAFCGSDDEVDMVKYLLQCARVLEVLKVDTRHIQFQSHEKELEIRKMLLALPRASNTCDVVFT